MGPKLPYYENTNPLKSQRELARQRKRRNPAQRAKAREEAAAKAAAKADPQPKARVPPKPPPARRPLVPGDGPERPPSPVPSDREGPPLVLRSRSPTPRPIRLEEGPLAASSSDSDSSSSSLLRVEPASSSSRPNLRLREAGAEVPRNLGRPSGSSEGRERSPQPTPARGSSLGNPASSRDFSRGSPPSRGLGRLSHSSRNHGPS